MRLKFYKPTVKVFRSTQAVHKSKRPRPKLSKELCAALTQRRRQSQENFRSALHEGWAAIDKMIAEIAMSHNKSVRRVQSELHSGTILMKKKWTKTNAWNAFLWKVSQDKENESELSNCFSCLAN